jgi:hypothetical protein
LCGNVDHVAAEDVVQLSEHARQVALNLNEPGPKRSYRQLKLGKFTAPTVEPPSLYSISLRTTSIPILS